MLIVDCLVCGLLSSLQTSFYLMSNFSYNAIHQWDRDVIAREHTYFLLNVDGERTSTLMCISKESKFLCSVLKIVTDHLDIRFWACEFSEKIFSRPFVLDAPLGPIMCTSCEAILDRLRSAAARLAVLQEEGY